MHAILQIPKHKRLPKDWQFEPSQSLPHFIGLHLQTSKRNKILYRHLKLCCFGIVSLISITTQISPGSHMRFFKFYTKPLLWLRVYSCLCLALYGWCCSQLELIHLEYVSTTITNSFFRSEWESNLGAKESRWQSSKAGRRSKSNMPCFSFQLKSLSDGW